VNLLKEIPQSYYPGLRPQEKMENWIGLIVSTNAPNVIQKIQNSGYC
jgi:hypothetical protein